MTRAVFSLFELFGVHQNDEFGLCHNGSNMATHARAFGSVAVVTFRSITVNRLHRPP